MKAGRQKKILEIIASKVITTQEELVEELKACGYRVTQATVCRDIKELGLIKIPAGDETFRYALPQQLQRWQPRASLARLQRMLRESAVYLDYTENIIVIKTMPGEAQGLAAGLDQLNWPEIVGTVAGDDTIFLAIKPRKKTPEVVERLQQLMRG